MYLNNPEFVRVGDKKYKINTDYRVAIRCQEVAEDSSINDYERALGLIYLLYGEDGLKATNDYEKLLELGVKYLQCGQENDKSSNEELDMSFKQDFSLIQASFMSDYGIALKDQNIHWWDFYTYLNGLTDKCVLNRVRELRTMDLNDIQDPKTKHKIREMQKKWELKKPQRVLTEKEQKSVDNFFKLTGLKREE